MNKIYFPNLNGLRFIAALLVLIHHAEQIKFQYKLSNYWDVKFVRNIGQLGVILFFVLSGFLITYLLLKEKELTKTISVKQFYMRRILRIWPLYYLLICLALFVFPHFHFLVIPGMENVSSENYLPVIALFILFLPNIALVMFPPLPFASQAWSVGVEEQFYLIWPWIIKKTKNVLVTLSSILLICLALNWIFPFLKREFPDSDTIGYTGRFWEHFNIDCMAIGGIFAWILFSKKALLLNILYNKYLQLFVYFVTIIALLTGFYFPVFFTGFDINCEGYAVLFAYIILNLAANPNSIISLENRLFSYLGKISYGLYMYHVIAIVISIKITNSFFKNNNFVFYFVAFGIVILLASVSFEFFEKKFIIMKATYSKIVSGDNAESK